MHTKQREVLAELADALDVLLRCVDNYMRPEEDGYRPMTPFHAPIINDGIARVMDAVRRAEGIPPVGNVVHCAINNPQLVAIICVLTGHFAISAKRWNATQAGEDCPYFPIDGTIARETVSDLRRQQAALRELLQEGEDDAGGERPEAATQSASPGLTLSERAVLQGLYEFGPESPAHIASVAERMEVKRSDSVVRKAVKRLIELGLAERPEGERNGARLTIAGRDMARKIAD